MSALVIEAQPRWQQAATLVENGLELAIQAFLIVDCEYDHLNSMVQLAGLANVSVIPEQMVALEIVAEQIINASTPLLEHLHSLSAYELKTQGLDKHSEWLVAAAPESSEIGEMPVEVQQTLRQVGSDYLSSDPVALKQRKARCAALLARRITADRRQGGMPWSLRNRLQENHLSESCLNASTFDAARHYFRKLIAEQGHTTATLVQLRAWEAAGINSETLNTSQAMSWIMDIAHQLHDDYAGIINELVTRGRIRLSADPTTIPLCLDTPMGCWVQLPYQHTILDLMSLVHELGHSIQFTIHRREGKGHISISALDSERWAINFEQQFVAQALLSVEHPRLKQGLIRYLDFQRIELGARHQLLHQFELALYGLKSISVKTINRLWREMNQSFYGESVELCPDFDSAWCEVQHLFTAPFYLQLYPLALPVENESIDSR